MKTSTMLALVGIVLLVCVCLGFEGFLLIPFYLLTGWILYLVRFIRDGDAAWLNAAVVMAASAVLVLGLYFWRRGWLQSDGANAAWRRPLALIGIAILLAVGGIAVNDALFHAAWLSTTSERIYASRGVSAARTISANNMKQMSLAVQSYHESENHFPPGGTFDEKGRALHGWQTLLLPYNDQQALFAKIDLQQPWNAPANAEVMKERITNYQNPVIEFRHSDGYSLSHYAGNVHVLGPTKRTLADITDGVSHTMLMGEVSHHFKPWGMPGNWRDPALGLHQSPDGFGGPFSTGTLIVMCDGTVRSLAKNVSADVMKAIATPSGGEKVNLGDLD